MPQTGRARWNGRSTPTLTIDTTTFAGTAAVGGAPLVDGAATGDGALTVGRTPISGPGLRDWRCTDHAEMDGDGSLGVLRSRDRVH